MADLHETNAAAQSLHDQIMRLSCNPADYMNADLRHAYRDGHRHARHAAAELAAAYEAALAELRAKPEQIEKSTEPQQ